MLFRLREEDFRPEDRRARVAPTPPAAPARPALSDLSPEEWAVVHMILSDHQAYGEVVARGAGPAAAQADRSRARSGSR